MSSSETEGFTPIRAARTGSSDRFPLGVSVKQERSGMASPDTHIVVRNGWDEVVGEGDGYLSLDLERGLYTLRFERGGAFREEVIRHVAASAIEPNAPQATPVKVKSLSALRQRGSGSCSSSCARWRPGSNRWRARFRAFFFMIWRAASLLISAPT